MKERALGLQSTQQRRSTEVDDTVRLLDQSK